MHVPRFLRLAGTIVVAAAFLVGLPTVVAIAGAAAASGVTGSGLDGIAAAAAHDPVRVVVLLALVVVALCWLQLVIAVCAEIAAARRGRVAAPPRWVAGPIRQLAARLVGSVVLAATAATVTVTPVLAEVASHTALTSAASHEAMVTTSFGSSMSASTPLSTAEPLTASTAPAMRSVAVAEYVVQPGDTVWSVATLVFGDGIRSPELIELNAGRILENGAAFDPLVLVPGTTVRVPADASTVHVVRGDSQWRIAEHRLGEGQRWPELDHANRDRIHDPDLIYPGQVLRLPHVGAPHVVSVPVPPTPEVTGTDPTPPPPPPPPVAPRFGAVDLTAPTASVVSDSGSSLVYLGALAGISSLTAGAIVTLVHDRRRRALSQRRPGTHLGWSDSDLVADLAVLDPGRTAVVRPDRAGAGPRRAGNAEDSSPTLPAPSFDGFVVTLAASDDGVEEPLDIEACGVVAITGPSASALLARMALELAAQAQDGGATVMTVGLDPGLATDRLQVVDSLATARRCATPIAAAVQLRLDRLGAAGVFDLVDPRVVHRVVILVDMTASPADDDGVAHLVSLVDGGGRGATLVIAGASPADAVEVATTADGRVDVAELGIVDRRIGPLDVERRIDAGPPLEREMPVSGAAAIVDAGGTTAESADAHDRVTLHLLGRPRVDGAETLDARAVACLVALVARPEGIETERLNAMLTPGGAADGDSCLPRLFTMLRTALPGLDVVEQGTSVHLAGDHTVTTDVSLLLADLAAARRIETTAPDSAIATLTAALESLGAAAPFDIVGPDSRWFDWARHSELAQDAEQVVVDACALLARLALDAGDLPLAAWSLGLGHEATADSEALVQLRIRLELARGDAAAALGTYDRFAEGRSDAGWPAPAAETHDLVAGELTAI